jgi:hypothetical protein
VTGWRSSAVAGLIAVAALGCGYRPLNASAPDPEAPFTVIGSLPETPSSATAAAAEAGARSELARAGVLATASQASAGSSAIEIELLRVEEEGAGIAIDSASGAPLARGLRVTVTGRAKLWAAGGRSILRETGDVRSSLVVSRGQGDAAAVSAAVKDAARLAGRRLGERLARRILGLPDPAVE